jgi:hypothetical protein
MMKVKKEERKRGRAEKAEEKKKPHWCYFVSWWLGGKVFEEKKIRRAEKTICVNRRNV